MANQVSAKELVRKHNQNEVENALITLLLYFESQPDEFHRLCFLGTQLYNETFKKMAAKMKEMADLPGETT